MKFDIYNPYSNVSVTDFYVTTIEEALKKCGFKTERKSKLVKTKNNEAIVIVHSKDYIKAKLCGYKKVILWVQGIAPEESYMRNHSALRKFVLSLKEMPGIFFSDMILMVSKSMKKHYERKYKAKFVDRVFFMPCFNSELDKACFRNEGKYEKNIFTYTGGITAWQCFEETVKMYSEIEKKLTDCFFKVYTPDSEKAVEILDKYNVKSYSINYVSVKELDEELKGVKYGFVLREENPVNFVATPTKLSTYMSNGVIPIFSRALDDFSEASKGMKYVVGLNGFGAEEFFEQNRDISVDEIEKEYVEFFDTYYNKERYIKDMAAYIKEHLK